jgi:FAD/FMN-containing dehydrogenase
VFAALRETLTGEVETSSFMRRCYAEAAGIYAQLPRGVAFPATAADVRAAVAFCRRHGLPLTVRGAGSGLVGNNIGRGLVLDVTRHLNRVLGYDPETERARTEPGVTCDGLNQALRPHNRFLPPNPSSSAFCTLGGMVASNASGLRSVKYGSVAPWVTAISGVWGTGEAFHVWRPEPGSPPGGGAGGREDGNADPVLGRLAALLRESLPPPPSWITRVAKNSAGLRVWPAWDGSRLDPVELLVGSEGTLAVFTEIELRTAPLPGGRALLLAAFGSLDDLARAVELVRPLQPSGVEFLDATFLDVLRSGSGLARETIPADAQAVLYVETEAPTPGLASEAAREALRAVAPLALPGARLAPDAEAAERLWGLRRGASPALARLHPGLVTQQFVEDCAVPPGRFPDLLAGLRRIFSEEGIPVVLFGHAGESHVHANPLFDPRDPRRAERIERVAERVCGLVEDLDGTLSGEHGDGLARAAFARRRFGGALDFFGDVRRICDPDGVLNPGKIVPAPGWRTGLDLRQPRGRHGLAALAV